LFNLVEHLGNVQHSWPLYATKIMKSTEKKYDFISSMVDIRIFVQTTYM